MSRKIKPTVKQRRLAQELITAKSAQEAMIKANYSPNTALNPGANVLRSKGFLMACDEVGLTEEALAAKGREFMECGDSRVALGAWQTLLKSRGLLKNNIVFEKSEFEEVPEE